MKASVYKNYGTPNVLEIIETEAPIPKDNELLIKVIATTVNRTDCAMLTAKPFIMRLSLGLIKPKKQILGTDFAGVVERIGKDITRFKVGEEVFGFDDNGVCSHAEYLTISSKNAISRIPNNISFTKAAASIEGAHYAINFLNKVRLKIMDKVIVNGASGAIGSALVQILKHYGAEVTGICNTASIKHVQSIGADQIVDFTKDDFTEIDDKFDYVFDAVGKSTFFKCKRLLKPGGAYISSELGPFAQNIFLPLFTQFLGTRKVKFPIPVDRQASVDFVKELCKKGEFTPLIDREYKLSDIAEAFKYVLTGNKRGNVVIKINDEYDKQ